MALKMPARKSRESMRSRWSWNERSQKTATATIPIAQMSHMTGPPETAYLRNSFMENRDGARRRIPAARPGPENTTDRAPRASAPPVPFRGGRGRQSDMPPSTRMSAPVT